MASSNTLPPTVRAEELMQKYSENVWLPGNINEVTKQYGPIIVADNAHAIVGDVNIHSQAFQFPALASHLVPYRRRDGALRLGATKSKSSHVTTAMLWRTVRFVNKVQILESCHGKETNCSILIDILGLLMLSFTVYYRQFATPSLSLLFPKLRHIVAADAPIIEACRVGNVHNMRQLVATGLGNFNVVTPDNLTPLYFALESGNHKAVEEVILSGADLEITFGSNKTSALSWALYHRNEVAVRLLLNRYADLGDISLLGWSPIFYLWRDDTEVQPSCLKLLQILQTHDNFMFLHSHLGLVDVEGWSLVNRVASFGQPDELDLLISSGADLDSKVGGLAWDAVFNATYDGRLDNLKVLHRHTPDFDWNCRDTRGWTLLHVATAEGHSEVMEWLLRGGADPSLRSWPADMDVAHELQGLQCTPAQVAKAESLSREQRFLEVVSSCRKSS